MIEKETRPIRDYFQILIGEITKITVEQENTNENHPRLQRFFHPSISGNHTILRIESKHGYILLEIY